MATKKKTEDDEKKTAPEPTTPHDLHARGLMTPARFATYVGHKPKTVSNKVSRGDLPISRPMGGPPRIEPLVAYAARIGLAGTDLFEVHELVNRNRASPTVVDDVIAFIERRRVVSLRGRKVETDPTTAA